VCVSGGSGVVFEQGMVFACRGVRGAEYFTVTWLYFTCHFFHEADIAL
jgi:hypothetical protein